ncbi:TetR/AcrR family transcriptional regulator [Gandjariella thermophila]|uniref:TetR family transcriptional regulator n=1 Tax=Gandjariella thermophila TaxID=1931992 RepID=A0A4D4J561_9PSEU|nr:TetR/AcrR family transcriptional regulator C-terminal domain-containing protein [Gandjariella thermophila]GDY29117.1 TetR family transcriptional regulator [Gandjariella thermophila]
MGRPRQPILTRRRIIDAALAVIDAEGLDALSTRRLAHELGVRAPSLYNHFATKDEILDAVGDAIIERVDIAVFGTEDWRVALRRWARSYRAALAAHPNAVPFLARGPGRRPAALRLADAVYGGLVNAGWPRLYATQIGAMMRYFVAGSALGSFAMGFDPDTRLYAGDYPHLREAHLLREHRIEVDEGAFELGLASMIDSLARLYETVVGPLPPLADPCAGKG